ncbi:MAG TPA: hypothetical protein VFH45_02820, partial [Acidimicrobiales bacterium]|nr:hypothetical protein [Acidimicrobiales bacterium]
MGWPVYGVFALLGLWSVGPMIGLQVAAWASGRSFTGVDGPYAGDVYQYLAWVRDAGSHVVASDLFGGQPTAHSYLQPIVLLSGLLWRAGLPLVGAYLLWLPVAVAVLAAGYWGYVRRLVGPSAGARATTLLLAVFCLPPTAALMSWLHLGSPALRASVGSLAGQVFPAGSTLDAFSGLISLGLMPLFLIGAASLVEGAAPVPGAGAGAGADRPDRVAPTGRRLVLATSAAGLLATWLHPWQGEVLVLTAVAMASTSGSVGRARRLVLPIAA